MLNPSNHCRLSYEIETCLPDHTAQLRADSTYFMVAGLNAYFYYYYYYVSVKTVLMSHAFFQSGSASAQNQLYIIVII